MNIDWSTGSKFIFLDIDGVLNSYRSAVAFDGYGSTRRPYKLDEVAVRLVKKAVEDTGSYLVISSTWRSTGTQAIASILSLYGWHFAPVVGRTGYGHKSRTGRIMKWMDENAPKAKREGRFLAIDDSELEVEKFVHVDGKVGFGIDDFRETKRLLG